MPGQEYLPIVLGIAAAAFIHWLTWEARVWALRLTVYLGIGFSIVASVAVVVVWGTPGLAALTFVWVPIYLLGEGQAEALGAKHLEGMWALWCETGMQLLAIAIAVALAVRLGREEALLTFVPASLGTFVALLLLRPVARLARQEAERLEKLRADEEDRQSSHHAD